MENNTRLISQQQFINCFNEANQRAIILGDLDLSDPETKMTFYNEVMTCEELLDKHFNELIDVKLIFIERTELKNKDNNGTHYAPKIVFLTQDNKGIISFSMGIYNSMKSIYNICGAPPYKDFYFKFVCNKKGTQNIYSIKLIKKEKGGSDAKKKSHIQS